VSTDPRPGAGRRPRRTRPTVFAAALAAAFCATVAPVSASGPPKAVAPTSAGPASAAAAASTTDVAPAAASAPIPAARLVDAWRAALGADPDLGVSRAARAAGRAQAAQADTLWRPQVGLQGSAGLGRSQTSTDGAVFAAPGFGSAEGASFRTAVDGPSGRIALSARQPVWNPERSAQARQLRLTGDAAELEWLAAEQDAMLRVAERWLEVSSAMEALRVVQRQQVAVDRTLAETTTRYRIGDAPVTGTHEARARAAAVRAQVIAAETELELRRTALADVTGLPRGTEPTRLPAGDDAEPIGPLDRWLDEAAGRNPGIRLQHAAGEIARQEAARTERNAQASLELVAQAAAERITGNGDHGPAAAGATQGLVGIQFSLPLYTGGALEARREAALRRVELADAELERARRRVAAQVRSAWLGLSAAAGRITALEQARIASEARLGATRTGHRLGERTTVDLLDAENELAQVELSLARARTARLLDRLRLDALAGRLDESRLARIDAMTEPPR
jgi:outer membrane protein